VQYSLSTPRGGKYAVNARLCADQREPQQRMSRKSRVKLDVFDADYTALASPFSAHDVNSRSAVLGYSTRRGGGGARRRNPNDNNKHYAARRN